MAKKQLKRSLLSAAVAAAVAAPMAASAVDINPYFRVHSALQFIDEPIAPGSTITDSTWDLQDVASRFGFRGRHDLEGGGYVRAHVEVGMDASDTGILGGAAEGGRVMVGAIGGDWGELKLGRDYNPQYNATAGATTDPWYGISAPWYTGGGESRKGSGVTYGKSAGNFNFEIAVYIDDSEGTGATAEDFDELRAGLSGTAGPIYWGVGIGNTKETVTGTLQEQDTTAASVKWTGDNLWLAGTFLTCSDCAGVLNDDIDTISFVLNWTISDTAYLTVGFGTNEDTGTRDIEKTLFGAYRNLTKDVIIYTEIELAEDNLPGGVDTTDARFGLIINVR